MRIEILREAVDDLVMSYEFYERQSAGLGSYFLETIYREIEDLPAVAGTHRIHFGSHRYICRKFPFAVYYRVENEILRIRAVWDCRQDPSNLERRIKRMP